MAINTGHRGRARAWARTFYDAYPTLHGLYYPSSMNGNEPAIALNDRLERAGSMPAGDCHQLPGYALGGA